MISSCTEPAADHVRCACCEPSTLVQQMYHESPIACDLTAIPVAQRAAHAVRAHHLLFDVAQETQERSDGYAYRFDSDSYPLVAEFIANERRCCPFFRFVLEVTAERGPLWLHISGRDGVKDFLRQELAVALAASNSVSNIQE